MIGGKIIKRESEKGTKTESPESSFELQPRAYREIESTKESSTAAVHYTYGAANSREVLHSVNIV